jgi:AcrR family transcriptional regulator
MMPSNSSQERTQEDTRQRIISAATQLFGEVGYSQAATRRIAQAAGVNEVTLFRHFGSKKNLLVACIEAHNAAGFSATFEKELTGDYSEDIYRMAVGLNLDTLANMEILRLLICDARNLPDLREALLAGGRANMARLRDYFQTKIDSGVIRQGLPAEAMASAFNSLFSSDLLFENLFQGSLLPEVSDEELVRPLVDLFVRGTRAV